MRGFSPGPLPSTLVAGSAAELLAAVVKMRTPKGLLQPHLACRKNLFFFAGGTQSVHEKVKGGALR
jgi:hypothetical protein